MGNTENYKASVCKTCGTQWATMKWTWSGEQGWTEWVVVVTARVSGHEQVGNLLLLLSFTFKIRRLFPGKPLLFLVVIVESECTGVWGDRPIWKWLLSMYDQPIVCLCRIECVLSFNIGFEVLNTKWHCFITHKNICPQRVEYKQWDRRTLEIKWNDSNSFTVDKSEISRSEFCLS